MRTHGPFIRLCTLGAMAAATLSGCAAGLSTSHGPVTQGVAAGQQTRAAEEPQVERRNASDARRALASYEKRGYLLVGSSSFSSARQESEAHAVAQGRQLGADLVVLLAPGPAGMNPPASASNSPATAFGSNAGGIALEVGPARTRDALSGHPTPLATHRSGQRTELAAAYFVKQRGARSAP